MIVVYAKSKMKDAAKDNMIFSLVGLINLAARRIMSGMIAEMWNETITTESPIIRV